MYSSEEALESDLATLNEYERLADAGAHDERIIVKEICYNLDRLESLYGETFHEDAVRFSEENDIDNADAYYHFYILAYHLQVNNTKGRQNCVGHISPSRVCSMVER